MDKRFLITTAIEETWQKDCPVLFLGKWCNLYNRKETWENIDFKIISYHWDDREKLYKDSLYLENLYEKVLIKTANSLNKIHNTDNSLNYWRILIGPWLFYFISVVFDRFTMIKKAENEFDILGTKILLPYYKTVPKDISEFGNFVWEDFYNHIIYGYIIKNYTNIPYEDIPYIIKEEEIKSLNKKDRLLRERAVSFLKFFKRETDFFIKEPYIPSKINFLLQLSLFQIPNFWERVPFPKIEVKENFRENFKIEKKSSSQFEECLISLIEEQIPIVYLEGYKKLLEISSSLPWPKRPKTIFTATSQNSDEVFKAWAGKKTEEKTPLVIGQHGGSYGCALYHFSERHEKKISSSYLTWGWGKEEEKVKPIGALKILNKKFNSWDKNGHLLIVMMTMPRYSYIPGSYVVSANQVESYFKDVYNFVDNLSGISENKILVRNYIHDCGFSQEKRWRDKYQNVIIDSGKTPIKSLISKSRLYISTYNATTFLESLGCNIPTIMFWNPKYNELRESAKPYFEKLKEVGIFHENPLSASEKVSQVWHDVESWWNNKETQEAREFFCNEFAYLPERPVKKLKEALTFKEKQ